jgi:hypothetical protein
MEKGIIHIQLVHKPQLRESKRENRAHCNKQASHWTKCLIIINARPLGATPENPASLVPLQSTISSTLEPRTPLPSHDASEDQPEPHGQKRVSLRSTALPLWQRVAGRITPAACRVTMGAPGHAWCGRGHRGRMWHSRGHRRRWCTRETCGKGKDRQRWLKLNHQVR